MLPTSCSPLSKKSCGLWDVPRVTLDTTEPLQKAMRFYTKHGYAPSGRVADFFGMPLHEYVKPIGSEL